MKKALIGIGGGGFAVQAENLIRFCPLDIKLILVAHYGARKRLATCLEGHPHQFVMFRGFHKQHRNDNSIMNVLSLIVGTWSALRIIREHRPDAVISIGQRVSAYLMAASRLAGVPGYFVECVTRVSKGSATGRFISLFRLTDKIYVQWPESTKLYRNAVYRGRLV
jgi:UDP-N-acetylglucosamine:LPS N-acetylglucosamine transferase